MICPFCFNGSQFTQLHSGVFQCGAGKIKIILGLKKIEVFKDGLRSIYGLISKKAKKLKIGSFLIGDIHFLKFL
jgi:hypothetical protein